MKSSRSAYLWLALAICYAVVSLLAPTNKSQVAKFHLSNLDVHIIDLTIVIPIVVIFFFAYYGFYYLRRYSQKIKGTPDGTAFLRITAGVGVFAYGTLASSILQMGMKWIAQEYPSFLASSTRISNYLGLIVPLVAFWLISDGVNKLVMVGKIKFKDIRVRLMLLILSIVTTSYAFITFHQNSSALKTIASGPNIYYLSPWLVLFTLVIPYVFAWSVGLLSIMQIIAYQQKITGLLYRKAIKVLARGFAVVLLSYILVEYLVSLSSKLYTIDIGWILVIIYALFISIGIGYLFIAIGANRLKRIEDV